MTNYRRNFVPGARYFYTVNLANRRSQILTARIGLLRSAFRYTRARHPFTIEAIVVLPDHLHAIWTLPDGDADFALRWRLIKSTFSRSLQPSERISGSRRAKGERGFGSGATGSIRFVMRRILLATPTTSTTTLSNMAMRRA